MLNRSCLISLGFSDDATGVPAEALQGVANEVGAVSAGLLPVQGQDRSHSLQGIV